MPKVHQNKEDFNFHPTVKPVELMHHLTKLVTFKAQTVLDPFMGNGSMGVACEALNRKFVGYECDPHYFDIAVKRLSPFKPQKALAEKIVPEYQNIKVGQEQLF